MATRNPWASTPRHKRARKPLTITLDDAERARLEAFARARRLSLSRAVAALLEACP